jgi:hypothetical protein
MNMKKSELEEIRAEPGRLGEARPVKSFHVEGFAGVCLKDYPSNNFSFDSPCTGF